LKVEVGAFGKKEERGEGVEVGGNGGLRMTCSAHRKDAIELRE
jgi:hypothetical protein